MVDKAEMILKNDGLVGWVLKKYHIRPWEAEDLRQVGRVGLIKAANHYDSQKGVAFSTYATKVIENEVKAYLARNRKHYSTDSLDRPVAIDPDGNEVALYAHIPDPRSLSEKAIEEYNMELLLEQIGRLPEEEKNLLFLLYPLEGEPLTQMQAAEKLGLNPRKVSEMKIRVLLKLRRKLSGWEY